MGMYMALAQLIRGEKEVCPLPPERTVAKKELIFPILWQIIAPLHLAPS